MRNLSLGKEKRDVKRYELPLKLSYSAPLSGYRGESLTKNISKRGIRFQIGVKISKDAILDIKIENPYTNSLISSKAKVVWVKEFINNDSPDGTVLEAGVQLLKRSLY
jgi:hypothetical protein